MNTTKLTRTIKEHQAKLKTILAVVVLSITMSANTNAQDAPATQTQPPRVERYGNTLNLGVGIGYYAYVGYPVPFVFANYEINVARSFTLAPFIGFGSYRSYNDYYYGGQYYYYHETVVPIGVKGTYYFDRLLHANMRWDFYLAASLGFVYDRVVWDDGYRGDEDIAHSASPLYMDLHIGAEYHLTRRTGVFLDLSTGVSTIGFAFHHL